MSFKGFPCVFVRLANTTLVMICLAGCQPSDLPTATESEAKPPQTVAIAAAVPNAEEVESKAIAFCGDCHAMPNPASFSKDRWAHEVQRGYDFYFTSGRADLVVPKSADIREYFVDRAPAAFEFQPVPTLDTATREAFSRLDFPAPTDWQALTAGSSLQVIDFASEPGRTLVQTDMSNGAIMAIPLAELATTRTFQTLAKLEHPCRAAACDFGKGIGSGLIVAELGSFLPADHALGGVVFLKQEAEALTFSPVTLLAGVGRVADVQPGDIDGDGDTDLVVAEFGWHETGSLLWMENIASSNRAQPQPVSANTIGPNDFVVHQLDPRPGAMEVRICDLNGDEHADILCLFAQEYEELVAFISSGNGEFGRKVLFSASDPSFGSSGFQTCDLDADGDLDILLTNGDSFDSFQAKPYHAIHWLENLGDLKFATHRLAHMPGAHRAVAADLDNDGDQDIVASAFLPENLVQNISVLPASLMWLENDGQQRFEPRALSIGGTTHPALIAEDLNGDGLVDLATTNFFKDMASPAIALEVWLRNSKP